MASSETQSQAPQLTAYRSLLDNALAMLRAAREARWDDLTALDAERDVYLDQVVQVDLVSTRPADIEVHTRLIQSILECDEQTKSLLGARQDEIFAMLGSIDNERKLENAYRSG